VPERPRRLLLFAVTVLCAVWTPFSLHVMFFPNFPATPPPQDFTYYIVAARIGLEHGWSQIYDLELQKQAFYAIRGSTAKFNWATVFVSLPPMAWLVAPLALLPYSAAYWSWIGLLLIAYFAAGVLLLPGDRVTRAAILAAGIWIHPLVTNLQMGQNSLLVAVTAAVATVLVGARREAWAGVLLGIAVVLKPQVAALVPVTLLIWGARRTFFACTSTVLVLGVLSLASLGGTGLEQLRSAMALESAHADNAIWTPAIVVGRNWIATSVQVACLLLGLVAAVAARGHKPEYAAIAGLLATLLFAGYHHEHDFVAVLIAGWLWLRTRPRLLPLAWGGAVFVALAVVAPKGPAPVIVLSIASLVLLTGGLALGRASGVGGRDRGLAFEQAPAPASPVQQ